MSSTTPILVLTGFTLLLSGLIAAAVAPHEHHTTPPPNAAPTGNDHRAAFDLAGTGWTSIDTQIRAPTDLRFHLTHDTLDDLCVTSRQGAGLYDEGHHTVVHLWPLGKDPFTDGKFLVWIGTPHLALPIMQTGVCGESSAIHLEPGDTARLVVATTLPGFRIELLGDNASSAPSDRHVALQTHPDHIRHSPLPDALVAEETIAPVVTVAREWRSGFDTGAAALYGLPWLHTETDTALPAGGFQVVGRMDWGFEGATEHVAEPAPLTKRGGLGTTTDWAALFAASSDGGPVDGYVTEHQMAGAYATSYETGASFLGVPLEPVG